MTTVFTDVRIKRFLEMRGDDAGRPDMMIAQSAFWTGLLYDESALEAAAALMRKGSPSDYLALRGAVPELALDAPWGMGTVRDLARDLVVIAEQGLRARGRLDCEGRDERIYLDPLLPLVHGAPTQAEFWLQRYKGEWQGDVRHIFPESSV